MGTKPKRKRYQITQLVMIQTHFIQLEMLSLVIILWLGWLASFIFARRFVMPPVIVSMWIISAVHLTTYAEIVQSLGTG